MNQQLTEYKIILTLRIISGDEAERITNAEINPVTVL